jgi:S1-C subfamily serine protease
MTPDQEQQLQRSVVKLLVGGGWGTGFCVAPGLILTCAHVVKAAQDGLVRVDWQGQERFTEAQILQVFPDTTVDLALLQVNGGEAIPWLPLDGQVQSGDDLYTYGYPRHYPDGAPVTLTVEGITGQGFIKFKAGAVQKGLSGAPLLNPRTGKVCGLVKYKEDFNNPVGRRGWHRDAGDLGEIPSSAQTADGNEQSSCWPQPRHPLRLAGAPAT